MKRLYRSHLVAIASLLCLAFVGCGTAGQPATPAATLADNSSTTPVLTLDWPVDSQRQNTRSYDTISMGRIAQGDVIEGEFAIRNNSERPLVIIQVMTGCGCTTAQYDTKPIAPAQNRKIRYRFESKTLMGQQFKSIEVVMADRSVVTVYLSGEIYVPKS